MTPIKFGFGGAVTRKEDDALLRGAGRYVADHAPDGALHAVVLRSPHAHARFRITDVAKAAAMPGVALVLTASDTADLGNLPCQGAIPDTEVSVPPYPILAREEVRHVGDAVAFVVAQTLDQARDAAEAIAIEWDVLPHVVGAAAALAPGAPLVWPPMIATRANLAFETELGDADATARAFAKATRTVALTLVNQRLVANYLDTRGVVAEYDGARITLTLSSQGSHAVRDVLCTDVLKIAKDKMRVVTPDVGGGFGTKLFPYREYALAGLAAQRLARPVKWVADRSEHFLGDAQGRDNVTTAKLALDGNGRFLALDVDLIADMGAYLSCYAPFIPFIGAGMSPGLYDVAACHVRVRGAFTNTVPVDAYRGAGRPEAAYVIERLVDVAAHEIGVAPDELRRKNFIKAMPYTTATGKTYDSGDSAAICAARRAAPTGTDLNGGSRSRARSDDCAASASRPTSRRAATTAPTPRAFASMTTAASPSWSGRNRRARATPPLMRRSSPITSTSHPLACGWSRATPISSPPALAPAARVRSRVEARRSPAQRGSLPTRSRRRRPTRSKRP